MKFKDETAEDEFKNIPPALRIVCDYFVSLSNSLGIEPVVTRVKEPIQGESGVHQANRAVDFRNEIGLDGPRLYTDEQAQMLVDEMNKRFPRNDGRMVCIHHAFKNHCNEAMGRAPYHFHVQVSYQWANDYQTMPKAT